MQFLELPFNWANIRAQITGARLTLSRSECVDTTNRQYKCLVQIASELEMRRIRSWIQDQLYSPYEKFGCFVVKKKPSGAEYHDYVAVRFSFDNNLDLDFFRMSCQNAHMAHYD